MSSPEPTIRFAVTYQLLFDGTVRVCSELFEQDLWSRAERRAGTFNPGSGEVGLTVKVDSDVPQVIAGATAHETLDRVCRFLALAPRWADMLLKEGVDAGFNLIYEARYSVSVAYNRENQDLAWIDEAHIVLYDRESLWMNGDGETPPREGELVISRSDATGGADASWFTSDHPRNETWWRAIAALDQELLDELLAPSAKAPF
jgi:hypothetical protein